MLKKKKIRLNVKYTHIRAVIVPYAKPSSLVFAKPMSKAAVAVLEAAPPLGMAAMKTHG